MHTFRTHESTLVYLYTLLVMANYSQGPDLQKTYDVLPATVRPSSTFHSFCGNEQRRYEYAIRTDAACCHRKNGRLRMVAGGTSSQWYDIQHLYVMRL